MTQDSEANAAGVDFALVAYREEGVWQLEELSPHTVASVESLAAELRRYPGDGGALGLVSVDEDFFVLVRVLGEHVRVLLSDITAAGEWPIARSIVDFLGLPHPEPDDEQLPAGDPAIVADLGLDAMDMGALLDDFALSPDELLGDVAHRLGFGRLYDELLGVPTP